MFKSDVVEVDGVFVGTAILQPNRIDRAFFATDDRVRPMHGKILPSLAAVRWHAARQFHSASPRSVADQICRPVS
ncbi:hypothetical protein HN018_15815 [Lichenicola cladoniae]|uniref:Uncharacterized protein n=1 Tax=Lichenicola cladoniae TaxID=1484109 RepID=A0A6M8HSS0_9PROT|nr:hypothetical protein [Lichenicola cladoniae]NPD65653.1 hypothetical protein [Acetobacteraceae bacterium]QKE91316.1 hypothetical protein HN018_15815 [Lichenicola cladoniae]